MLEKINKCCWLFLSNQNKVKQNQSHYGTQKKNYFIQLNDFVERTKVFGWVKQNLVDPTGIFIWFNQILSKQAFLVVFNKSFRWIGQNFFLNIFLSLNLASQFSWKLIFVALLNTEVKCLFRKKLFDLRKLFSSMITNYKFIQPNFDLFNKTLIHP